MLCPSVERGATGPRSQDGGGWKTQAGYSVRGTCAGLEGPRAKRADAGRSGVSAGAAALAASRLRLSARLYFLKVSQRQRVLSVHE